MGIPRNYPNPSNTVLSPEEVEETDPSDKGKRRGLRLSVLKEKFWGGGGISSSENKADCKPKEQSMCSPGGRSQANPRGGDKRHMEHL